jgi:hypothetical protein
MLVLKLAVETLSADEAVVEDAPSQCSRVRDQRIAQGLHVLVSIKQQSSIRIRIGCDECLDDRRLER